MEYIFTDLPRYAKMHSRTEFQSSPVQSGSVLLFTEDGESLTAKLPSGEFISVGGGTIPDDLTATAAAVRSGYTFIGAGGTEQTGTLPDGTVTTNSDGSTTLTEGYYPAQTIPAPAEIGKNLIMRFGDLTLAGGGTVAWGSTLDGVWEISNPAAPEAERIWRDANYNEYYLSEGSMEFYIEYSAQVYTLRSGSTLVTGIHRFSNGNGDECEVIIIPEETEE